MTLSTDVCSYTVLLGCHVHVENILKKKNARFHRTNHTCILQNIVLINTKMEMCPLQSNQWLAIQMWNSMTNFAIILKVKSGSSGMTSYRRFDLFQCCFVSNGNSFQNRVICLRKFNQTQPWEQHWHSTSPDCGLLRNTEAFHRVDTWP